MLDVGGEPGGALGEVGALFAEGFGVVAEGAEFGVELTHASAQFGGLGGEACALGQRGGARLDQRAVLCGEAGRLLLAADFFRACGLELLLDLRDARGVRVGHAAGLLEGGECVAAALFQPGERGGGFGGGLLQGFALLAECVELLLQFGQLRLQRGAFALEGGGLLLEAGDCVLLLRAGLAVALGGLRPLLQAALDARGLLLHLAEGGAGVGGFALGVAALLGLGVERGGEFAGLAFAG